MGNLTSKIKRKNGLRDKNYPSSLAKPTSNYLFALLDDYFYPCQILGKSYKFYDGYFVKFFHNNLEIDIQGLNCIGNMKALIDHEVCCRVEGETHKGRVYDVVSNEQGEETNFFINLGRGYIWISLPFVYLSLEQARKLIL